MSDWKKEKKEENKLLIVFGILLIILGIYLFLTADGGFKLIAFIPIPNWAYALGAAGVGVYALFTGLTDK